MTLPALSRRDLMRLTVLGSAGAVSACASTGSVTTPSPSPASPDERRWGAFIPSVTPAQGATRTPLQQLTNLAGTAPRYVHRFCALGDPVPVGDLDAVVAFGATPLLTLEPWKPDGGTGQPEFALSHIASGAFDTEFTRWGTQLASWGKPVLVRFAQEMNGTWYPWAVGVNGNTAADYRAAWARMRSVITDRHSDNVRFVWAPNALTLGTNPFGECYPGRDQIDVLGLDGYNWGEAPGHHWQPAADLFVPSLETLRALDATHPILLTEVGCADGLTAQDKASWIRDFFSIVDNQSRVEGFVWFQMDKERDWRFNSTTASTAAFRAGVAGW
ncbi:glycoside hydrolase family 26 protein [uncultured Gordonia sp.]|uniref:glycoside hydrolase family 26 protein n=1 Tax=uncultured Gordonia sp. TaxID=198437 RepID=UPI0025873E73|nr:glycosyl hydrolase [uncultured Gordonia sp.]